MALVCSGCALYQEAQVMDACLDLAVGRLERKKRQVKLVDNIVGATLYHNSWL